MESVAAGRPFSLEYRLVRRDGSICWVLERGLAPGAGDGRWWLDGAIFDITQRREAERAMREHAVTEAQLSEVRAWPAGSWRPPTAPAATSSATSTTARSSGSSPSRWACASGSPRAQGPAGRLPRAGAAGAGRASARPRRAARPRPRAPTVYAVLHGQRARARTAALPAQHAAVPVELATELPRGRLPSGRGGGLLRRLRSAHERRPLRGGESGLGRACKERAGQARR